MNFNTIRKKTFKSKNFPKNEDGLEEEDSVQSEAEDKYDSDSENSSSSLDSEKKDEEMSDPEEKKSGEESQSQNEMELEKEELNQIFSPTKFKFIDQKLINLLSVYSKTFLNLDGCLGHIQQSAVDDLDKSKFYCAGFNYILQCFFLNLQNQDVYQQIIVHFDSLTQVGFKLLSFNMSYVEDQKNIEIKEYTVDFSKNFLEIYFAVSGENGIKAPLNFISYAFKYLNIYLQMTDKKDFQKNSLIAVKQYMKILYHFFVNHFDRCSIFSQDDFKNLFLIGCQILLDHGFSDVFLTVIDILTLVFEYCDEKIYTEKLMDYLIDCFTKFIDTYSFKNPFYKLDRGVIRRYHSYFGEYNTREENVGNISLFTYLFLKCFNIWYYKINDNFEEFIKFTQKIQSKSNPNTLLCFYCLIDDLLKLKYSFEFSITLHIIGNIQMFLTDYLKEKTGDLNTKKFFLALLELIIDNYLKDLKKLSQDHLCFTLPSNKNISAIKKVKKKIKAGDDVDMDDGQSDSLCECFSCSFTTSNKNESLRCKLCKCLFNSNFNISGMDDSKESESVCFLCQIENFLETNGMIVDIGDNAKFFDSNEEIINQNAQTQNLPIFNTKPDETESSLFAEENKQTMFEKLLAYQDIIFGRTFPIIKMMMFNFVALNKSYDSKVFSKSVDYSFKNFLNFIIGKKALDNPLILKIYNSFEENYKKLKDRLSNVVYEIKISTELTEYYLYFYYYLNLLFNGQWQVIRLLLNRGVHFHLKRKCFSILTKFTNFEKDSNIFHLVNINLANAYKEEESPSIRELYIDFFYKLYQNKKVTMKVMVDILINSLGDTCFLVRKRVIQTLIAFFEEDINVENETVIIFYFLKKISDKSESDKIKAILCEFFVNHLNRTSKTEKVTTKTFIDIFVNKIKEHQSEGYFVNSFAVYLNKLFSQINPRLTNLSYVSEYLCKKYLINIKGGDKDNILAALSLLKILTQYEIISAQSYMEFLLDGLEAQYDSAKKVKIMVYTCKIIENIFKFKGNENNERKITLKYNVLNSLNKALMTLIDGSPANVMYAALEAYFALLNSTMISSTHINELIKGIFLALENDFIKKKISKNYDKSFVSRALPVIGMAVNNLKDNDIKYIFQFSETLKDKLNDVEIDLKDLIDIIFEVLSFYALSKPKEDILPINFDAFEGLTYFWIKYPDYLKKSENIIDHVMKLIKSDKEKLRMINVFKKFYTQIEDNIKECQKKIKEGRQNEGEVMNDYGKIHLYFDKYSNNFASYLSEGTTSEIKLAALDLLNICIDSGNIDLFAALPHIFASLFDYYPSIRFESVKLLEKIINVKKKEFYTVGPEMIVKAYNFHKNNYIDPKNLNGFVKYQSEENKDEYLTNIKEYFLDLFLHKLSKIDENGKIRKNFLKIFTDEFNKMNNLELTYGELDSTVSNVNKVIKDFDYYEFVAKLIGDFKYKTAGEILYVINEIYPKYDEALGSFKTKLKDYKKEDHVKKMNMKTYLSFLFTGLRGFLIKYLLIKYDTVITKEEIEKIPFIGWSKFYETVKTVHPDLEGIQKKKRGKKKKNDSDEDGESKKGKGIKFKLNIAKYPFTAFYEVYQIILNEVNSNYIVKEKKFHDSNMNSCKLGMKKLKKFVKISYEDLRNFHKSTVVLLKAHKFKDKLSSYPKELFKMIYEENNNPEDSKKAQYIKSTISKLRKKANASQMDVTDDDLFGDNKGRTQGTMTYSKIPTKFSTKGGFSKINASSKLSLDEEEEEIDTRSKKVTTIDISDDDDLYKTPVKNKKKKNKRKDSDDESDLKLRNSASKSNNKRRKGKK
ncbi:MAG: hypothetical protein MJ252_01180 [archaeon]|nr:hypothetical protein [archaeon]